MNWRPEGWENPYPDEPREAIRGGIYVAYEAGADAILEALKAKGCTASDFGRAMRLGDGWLVFIPDEEEK